MKGSRTKIKRSRIEIEIQKIKRINVYFSR
jgi:ribosomal protein L20A (L18A)